MTIFPIPAANNILQEAAERMGINVEHVTANSDAEGFGYSVYKAL